MWTKEKRTAYMKEYNKRYYAENIDKERLRVKANRMFKNKEACKKWAAENKDKIQKYNRSQYLKNRDKRLEYQKKYYQEHRVNYKKLYKESIENLGDWYINGLIRKLKKKVDKELVKKSVIKSRDKKIKLLIEKISGQPKRSKPYEFAKNSF